MPTALITGASRGFGYALAAQLANRGWRLVVDARTASNLHDTVETLGDVSPIAGDVTDNGHQEELVGAAASQGDFELLVNNASVLGPSPLPSLESYSIDALRDVLEVNLLAPLRLIQRSLPHLRRNGGRIVNITSDAAVQGYGGWGGYGASKAALEQLSNVLAAEEAGVRVYWFDPGDMRTRMHQEAFPGEDISDRPLPETRVPGLLRLLEERPPSGRYTAEQFLTGVS